MARNSEWVDREKLRDEKGEADASLRKKHHSKQAMWVIVSLVILLVGILLIRGTLPHRRTGDDPTLIKRNK
jgi:hypothetical protein